MYLKWINKLLCTAAIVFWLCGAHSVFAGPKNKLLLGKVLLADFDVNSIEHRGVYINNFKNDILGVLAEEEYLLKWCVVNNFSEITLYNIGSILDSTSDTALLKEFVARAHEHYNLKVGFVAASKATIQEIKVYNGLSPLVQSPDAIATEYEFWNTGYNFKYFKKMLKKLTQVDPLFHPSWQQQLYVGKFEDEAGMYSDAQVLHKIVKHLHLDGSVIDELFWVNYRTNAQNFPNPLTAPNSYGRIQSIANESYS